MKKLIAVSTLLLFVASVSFAQKSFEGTIKFTMKYLGEGIDQFEAFMPTGSTYSFKGNDYRTKIEGGMAAAMIGDILVIGKSGQSYMIKDNDKIAYKFEADDKKSGEAKKPVVTKEDEVISILNHNCQKYKVEIENEGNSIVLYCWATTDIKLVKPANKAKSIGGSSSGVFMEGVEGVILKKMTTMTQMGMTITTIETASEIKEAKLDKKLFTVPKNYKVEDGALFIKKLQGGGL